MAHADRPSDDAPGPLLDQKQDGVAVLVTGAVPTDVHRSMSKRLLGSPDADRRRVLALTRHDEHALRERLPEGARTTPDSLGVVLGDGWTRSAAATSGVEGPGETVDAPLDASPSGFDGVPEETLTVLDDPSLSTFGERLARTVTRLRDTAGGFDPGQLRLGLDSIDHLADDYGDDEVLRFTHLLADQVRNDDGMIHLHTHRDHDELPVARLADVADVVIRLRLAGDGPEFRPYLDGDPLTDWGPFPPVPR